MSDLFGWDLIYKISENSLKKKEDVLTLFIHYALIKGGYKCIGLGDDKVLTGNEVASETLPTDWNNDSNYSIRYNLNNNLYILKGLPVDSNIVYNLLKTEVIIPQLLADDMTDFKFNFKKFYCSNESQSEMKVSNVAFHTESVVASLNGDLSSLIPSHEEILKKIQTELLVPMGAGGSKKEATTQSQTQETGREGRNGRPQPPWRPPAVIQPDGSFGPRPYWADPERDPLRVGRSDLDPLVRHGGGGMLFDPFGRGPPNIHDPTGGLGGPHLPRGAIPPGARFDPFGPMNPNPPRPRRPPGSDEFHPPGFGDMFM